MAVLTKRIDDLTKGKSEKGKNEKGKSEKGLIAELFDWDEEFVSSEDEQTTRIRAFMAIAEDGPSVGKADARSGQWVNITIKKITSDSESECETQEPLSPLPKLKRVAPAEHATIKKTLIKLKAQSPLNLTPKKAPMIPKPFKDCKYFGFNDHHSDNCEYYPRCEVCGSVAHEPVDYLKRSVWYLDSGCYRHMTWIKQYLHRYSKESGPKVVFGDDSSRDIEGYDLVNCNGITFTKVAYVNGLKHNLISISQLCDANFKVLFTKTREAIFNQNDEVFLIDPRRRDVYVIDMSSFNKESNACFFAKASPSVNWLWHKRLTYLNFRNINNLAKHNLVSGLPSLTFSKDKNCLAYEKGKHHKASFKTKRSFSIKESLHLLYMDLFGPVKPQTISHNKYTLVIIDEYSRYTWVFYLQKNSDTADCIMSFIRKMENLNEVRVKELRSDNGTEFRNHKLEELFDEKGISQNISSPYTPEQNEAVNTACFTQNRSIIVKRHGKTSYDVFRGRSPNISYFHVFRCPVHIHNHRDHLGKFDEKADDGFFLGYSFVAKAFRLFNIRRQEMEEIVHVTFSEDDEAISQSVTEGNGINFNENRTFPDDEFLEPRNEATQFPSNTEYFPYIPAYENTTPSETLVLQISVTPEDPPEFTNADDHPALSDHNKLELADHLESTDNLDSAECQDTVLSEPISDVQPSPIISPSAKGILQTLIPQDR
ncbi:retrovirus-related pol polyprotein from transposon TNT 1-94 [Tanacetum coccineum]